MELGSVTLKRIGFFCFPIKHSTHTPMSDPPARLRFNLKWGHRARFPALHSGTAQSNASLSSLSTPTNLTVATTEVSAAACYYVRGGGEEKESATDKTSCSRARAVCQSIGMLSLYLVAAARASARVSGCSCLCHLPI